MIVAARAGECQPHQATCDDIDSIVEDLVRKKVEARADVEKAERGQRSGTRLPIDEVRGDLSHDEAIEGHVLVERTRHPVAVSPRERILALTGINVALGVSVARDVEPVSPPPLAVLGSLEQSVDDVREGRRGRAGDERGDLLEGGRYADQVEVNATQQRARVRAR